jgi:hypothetical protein
MPSGREVVVIVGGSVDGGAVVAVIVMLNALVSLPALFAAWAVKLEVPTAVGVPEITPVAEFRFKPRGKAPLAIVHVIGAVPLAKSVWL